MASFYLSNTFDVFISNILLNDFSQKSSDRIQIEHIKSIYKSTYNVLGYAVYHIFEIENCM